MSEKLMPIEPGARCLYMGKGDTQEVIALELLVQPGPIVRTINGIRVCFDLSRHPLWWRLDRKIRKVHRHGAFWTDIAGEIALLRIDGIPDTVEREEKEKVEG